MTALFDASPLEELSLPGVPPFKPRGLVVIIGPNSSGKTQLLRDLAGMILGDARRMVVAKGIHLDLSTPFNDLVAKLSDSGFVRRTVDQQGNPQVQRLAPQVGRSSEGWQIPEKMLKAYFEKMQTMSPDQGNKFLEHVGPAYLSALFLDRRLMIVNDSDNFDYDSVPPVSEIQALHMDHAAQTTLEVEVSSTFKKCVVLDFTSSKLRLRVAEGSTPPTDRDRRFPEFMRRLTPIGVEGDGLRSYIGICVSLLVGRTPIILVDEPEMCLHPPQATAIGRFIGIYGTSTERTTFVATHSSHVLRGILSEASDLTIIRTSRNQEMFSVARIAPEELREYLGRPSSTVETILDGLFAESVTVVESENDRAVYASTWGKVTQDDKDKDGRPLMHETHFVSVNGVGGVPSPCSLYRGVGVPVAVVADLDIIGTKEQLRAVLESITDAGTRDRIYNRCNECAQKVIGLGPLISHSDVSAQLARASRECLDEESLQDVRMKLAQLQKAIRKLARLKLGKSGLSNEERLLEELDQIIEECNSVGLFLVSVGELEGWLGGEVTVGRERKTEWASAAVDAIRSLEPTSDDIWEFVRSISRYHAHVAVRDRK